MAEPLRILVVANLPVGVLGGAENQVARLVAEWCAAGAAVDVAGHRVPGGVVETAGMRVHTHHVRAGGSGRLVRAVRYGWSLTRIAWRLRRSIDVAYCRGLGDGALVLAVLKALRVCRWPLMVCPINARGDGDVAFLRSIPGWRVLARLVDTEVDAFNLINEFVADDLDAAGLDGPARHRIPNGIAIRPAVARAKRDGPRRLVWTGRLTRQKGLDLLIPALAAAAPFPWRLDLYGDGPERERLQSLADDHGLAGRLAFHAPVPPDAVRAILADADAFVLPSRYEGMSNAALEAMEAGLPVLCTRCGGIDRFVEDGAGWVCAPDDAQELADAVRSMLEASSDEWLVRGRRARGQVESRFDIEVVAARNLEVLAALAGAAR